MKVIYDRFKEVTYENTTQELQGKLDRVVQNKINLRINNKGE